MVGRIIHPEEVADEIGRALSARSKYSNIVRFSNYKARCEARTIDFSTTNLLEYNVPFSISELTAAISTLKSVAESPDTLHNDIIKRLSAKAL